MNKKPALCPIKTVSVCNPDECKYCWMKDCEDRDTSPNIEENEVVKGDWFPVHFIWEDVS